MDRLGNQVHPIDTDVISEQFRAVFQDDNALIHTAGTVQSWFAGHEVKLQHLPWPARSPDLIIIELLCPVLETRLRNRFPPPTSL
jgi:hypothetical protein